VEDYYAILGLDSSASPESIKLAYRRLARECHPDRNINSSEAERIALSARMAQLNGAYAVLSNETRRREYDNQARILTTLNADAVSNVSVNVANKVTKTNAVEIIRPPRDAEWTMVREFSNQLRFKLLCGRNSVWEDKALEGFDWGLECASWSSHYCVAGRSFAILNPAVARKFTNYSEIVVTRLSRSIRKSHFLFLLAFHHCSNWESVSAEFNRLLAPEGGEKRLNALVRFALFDVQRMRTLRVGPYVADKGFEELLNLLGNRALSGRSSRAVGQADKRQN
jgi:curved DNA-binding protein CbpA